MKLGDKNSKFFHACANQHRRPNPINSIHDDEEILCQIPEEIEEGFINLFKGMLTSSSPTGTDDYLEGLPRKVMANMNKDPLCIVTEEEVSMAINQMDPHKSHGLDGIPAAFYQDHWAAVGKEVFLAIKNLFMQGFLDRAVNYIYIALIPKKTNSSRVSDF